MLHQFQPSQASTLLPPTVDDGPKQHSGEELDALLEPRDEAVHIGGGAVDVQAGARRGVDAQVPVQRLRAVVPRPHRDACRRRVDRICIRDSGKKAGERRKARSNEWCPDRTAMPAAAKRVPVKDDAEEASVLQRSGTLDDWTRLTGSRPKQQRRSAAVSPMRFPGRVRQAARRGRHLRCPAA